MKEYKYIINKTKYGYRFCLNPGNKGSQIIGGSLDYENRELCINKLEEFKKIMQKNCVNNIENSLVNLIPVDNKYWNYEIKYNDEIIFKNDKCFTNKRNLNNSLKLVYENLDSHIQNEN